MYAALWRALPGPVWVRAAICVGLVAVAVVVCFTWVFPAVAPHLPVNDGTVGP
jgi:hypothetical protein